ncbi:MAG: hypothetical protein ACREL1_06315, partial [bacterium]
MKISEELLKKVFKPGVVVHLSNPGRIFGSDFHHHIILSNPTEDCDFLLVLVTSQVSTNKKIIKNFGWSPSTLVELKVADCPFLTKESAVNCNDVFAYSLGELKGLCDVGRINLNKGTTVSDVVLEKLRKAVLK